ncbi:MAG: CPBP family intramembrane glutamic endopeptidase [Pseudomonadales bacterium]
MLPKSASLSSPQIPLADIALVFAASALAFVVEDMAVSKGWVAIGPEARGVMPVLGGALAAIGVVLARGGSLADLGFRRPKRWVMVPFQVAVILAAFIAAQLLAPLLVSSYVSMPEPDLSRYDALAGDLGAAVTLALLLPLTASIPEEIIYWGFLIGRLTDLFGQGLSGAVVSVFLQALVFGAVHFMWGVGGMIVALLMGIVWGVAYLLCGRNLWVVILAHSTGHVLGVVQLYLGTSIIV